MSEPTVHAPTEAIDVRAVTRVDGKDVVMGGGRFRGLDGPTKKPRIVVGYPAGSKTFDAFTGWDVKNRWRVHPEDLRRIQRMFPDRIRAVRSRWMEGDDVYRTLYGMSFVDGGREANDLCPSEESIRRALLVVLSPARADHEDESRMLARVVSLADRERWDVVEIVALFSLVVEAPKDILDSADPAGPDNDRTILEAARRADVVIAAWGHAVRFGKRQAKPVQGRDERVITLLFEAGHDVVHALAATRWRGRVTTAPLHPSHAPTEATIVPWRTKSDAATPNTDDAGDHGEASRSSSEGVESKA